MSNLSEKIFVNKKVKNTVPWTYVINDLTGEEIIGIFYKNKLQGTNQPKFRIEKVPKGRVIDYMLNGKVMIIQLIIQLD